ncbi:MAG: hypothetical protein GY866_24050, partial [Proteobacteria bacterium]|nr:hypothetical protein [Pseudomonadota bacterium]
LEQLKKNRDEEFGECTQLERGVLNRLESIRNGMGKLAVESGDERLAGNVFFAQAGVLAESILKQIEHFANAISRFYDQTG